MKIYLASDHAGFELKGSIKQCLQDKNYGVEDCGAFEMDPDDDYPDFISQAAQKVSQDPENSIGIVFGGTGQGEAITANKFKNIRCALFYAPAVPTQAIDVIGTQSQDKFEIIKLARIHNNANMLSLSTRFLTTEDATQAVMLFLETTFPGDDRHKRRVEKIAKLES